MKTKAKLTLAISIMSAAVLAAGVTSTFAWFSTRSTVQFDTGTMTVNTLSKLKIDAARIAGSALDGTKTTEAYVEASPTALGSVSSTTGEHFFAPTTLGDNTAGAGKYTAIDNQSAIDTLVGDGTNKYVGYLKYNLMLSAEPSDEEAKDLKLAVTVTNNDANTIGKWYRVAVYKISSDATSVITTNQTAGAAVGTYAYTDLTGDNRDTAITSTAGATSATARTAISSAASITIAENFIEPEDEAVQRQHLCVAVWMEGGAKLGENVEDQNGAGGKTLNVNFTFSLVAHE